MDQSGIQGPTPPKCRRVHRSHSGQDVRGQRGKLVAAESGPVVLIGPGQDPGALC